MRFVPVKEDVGALVAHFEGINLWIGSVDARHILFHCVRNVDSESIHATV